MVVIKVVFYSIDVNVRYCNFGWFVFFVVVLILDIYKVDGYIVELTKLIVSFIYLSFYDLGCLEIE